MPQKLLNEINAVAFRVNDAVSGQNASVPRKTTNSPTQTALNNMIFLVNFFQYYEEIFAKFQTKLINA